MQLVLVLSRDVTITLHSNLPSKKYALKSEECFLFVRLFSQLMDVTLCSCDSAVDWNKFPLRSSGHNHRYITLCMY